MARFKHIVRRLAKPLLLDHWWLTVQEDGAIPHRADCEAAPEYREATLTFNPAKVADEDMLSFTIHEMMHCHVEELAHIAELLAGDDPFKRRMVERAEERLTTNLELILTPLLARIAEPGKQGKK